MTVGAALLLVAFALAVLLALVLVLRLHAFPALLLTSLLTALVGGIDLARVTTEVQESMGKTLGYISIVVALGAMIGELVQRSGGSREIATALLKILGTRRAPLALGLTGLVVAIPVFFDVAFVLLVPLVAGLSRRIGRPILSLALPLLAGLAVAHAFVPPTPGPVAVAGILGAEIGWVVIWGLLAGIPALVVGGLVCGAAVARRVRPAAETQLPATSDEVPPTSESSVPATSDEVSDEVPPTSDEVPGRGATHFGRGASHFGEPFGRGASHFGELGASSVPATSESSIRPPSAALAGGLVALPLALILLATGSSMVLAEGWTRDALGLIGHPFVALLGTLLLALYLLGARRGVDRSELEDWLSRALEPVGLILMVTGAGGVLGKVLLATGAGEALAEALAHSGLPLLPLGFLLSLAVRIAQGSATVSMVTAASLLAPLVNVGAVGAAQLGALTIAVAAGATACSHVNDSGFWLVSRYLGLTPGQTLRSWTVVTTVVGYTGFLVVWVASGWIGGDG